MFPLGWDERYGEGSNLLTRQRAKEAVLAVATENRLFLLEKGGEEIEEPILFSKCCFQ
jgi:hypothetical protein